MAHHKGGVVQYAVFVFSHLVQYGVCGMVDDIISWYMMRCGPLSQVVLSSVCVVSSCRTTSPHLIAPHTWSAMLSHLSRLVLCRVWYGAMWCLVSSCSMSCAMWLISSRAMGCSVVSHLISSRRVSLVPFLSSCLVSSHSSRLVILSCLVSGHHSASHCI